MTELSFQAICSVFPVQRRKLYIAYSGGLDSHVLLHLCASQSDIKNKITAVYINHGLQKAADNWGLHCRQQCLKLAVDFVMINVDAKPITGESPEAAARNARYLAFEKLLDAGDVLLLAQHREDQMETLLLQLFRGSGIQGLAGMPVSMGFGKGLLLRPMLDIAKIDIQHYAGLHELHWVEDPSNRCDDFDRNFLRNHITPLLKQRWPSLDKTVARTAKHCGNAGQLLDEWAERFLETSIDPQDGSLLINKWWQFNENQRYWLLRCWLQGFGLKPPSQAISQAIIVNVINAKTTANSHILTQGYYIRKYRHKLFCIHGDYFRKSAENRYWCDKEDSLQMENGFMLSRVDSSEGIKKELWHMHKIYVKNRAGGEKIKLPGRAGRHCLKKLYQEAGIPPWERDLRPLVYLNDRLIAVAGLWVDESVWEQDKGNCYRILWQSV